MSLKIKNISKKFNNKEVLKSISFNAKAGDIVGLLGKNGAGKSTLMKTITGYHVQNNGTIQICDKDTLKHAKFTKSKIGYLSEENPLYENMYVREFLEFICNIHNLDYHKCNDVIQLTGLVREMNTEIKLLSKGFKQRVGLAQALIHNPDVLVLDEPTSGLDPEQLIEIRRIIKSVGAKKTILLSSHIIQEIEAMCNRIIIINDGQIIIDKNIEDFDKNIEQSFLKLIK